MSIPSVVIENHATTLAYWLYEGVQHVNVVHVDAHLDLGWLAQSAYPILKVCNAETILNYEQDSITFTRRGYFDIGSFLSVALALDITQHIYWVVPDGIWFANAGRLRTILLEQTQGIDVRTLCHLVEYDGRYEITLPKGSLTVCTLHTLPVFNEPVLLDIDLDFMLTSNASGYCYAWISPSELAEHLVKRLRNIFLLTIAISEHGGYTPIPWRKLVKPVLDELKTVPLQTIKFAERYPANALRNSLAYFQYTNGLVELLRKRPTNALPFLAKAVATENGIPGYHYAYAMALQRCGYQRDAITAYERACACSNDLFPRFLNDMAGALTEIGEIAQAQHLLEHAVGLEPESSTIITNLGRLLIQQNKIELAKSLFYKALALQPGHIEASYQLGNLLARLGKGNEGLDLLSKCVELSADSPLHRIALSSYRQWQRSYGIRF